MNSSVEKAASFSTLRARIPPLPPGEGWGEGKPCDELFSGKGCVVFHATALIAAVGRSYRHRSLRRNGRIGGPPWPR